MRPITRRQVVLCIAAASTAGLLGSEATEYGDDHPGEPEWTFPRLAAAMARMELASIKSNFPRHWQRLNYTGLIRWDESLVLFYGTGRRDQLDDDCAAFLAYLEGGPLGGDLLPIVGLHRTPCGRAWAAFVDPAAAGDCVADRGRPDWKQETLGRLRAFDLAVGREARQCVL